MLSLRLLEYCASMLPLNNAKEGTTSEVILSSDHHEFRGVLFCFGLIVIGRSMRYSGCRN